jgi:DNA-binding NtrC family response regulator
LHTDADEPPAATSAEPPTDVSPKARRRAERSTDRLEQDDAGALPEQVEVPVNATLKEAMEALERNKILTTLQACGGNQTRAARELGISRNTLLRKLDRYGVPRPRK